MSFPNNVRLVLDGAGEQDSDLVERSAMERGVDKTRRIASDVTVTVTGTLLFRSADAIAGFRAWYYSPAGANAGQAWFDWRNPRTGEMRSARFVSASMGALKPVAAAYAIATRTCALEYVERVDP